MSENANMSRNVETPSFLNTNRRHHQCSYCGKTFNKVCNLKTHLLTHTGERPHPCLVCNKAFTTKNSLNRHMVTHTGDRVYACSVCQKTFTQQGHLKEHILSHKDGQSYRCLVCKDLFTSANGLKKHLMRRHSEEWLRVRSLYQNTQQAHLNNKLISQQSYQCQSCEKVFIQSSDLKRHMMIHTDDRPHKCIICNKSFRTTGNVNRHFLTHTYERPYQCSTCNKKFMTISCLKRHVARHKLEESHKESSQCLDESSTNDVMDSKEHSLTGMDEHLVQRLAFDKASTMTNISKRHIVVRKGQRPYWCPGCLETFTHKEDLKEHVLTHTGEWSDQTPSNENSLCCSTDFNRDLLTESEIHNHPVLTKTFTSGSLKKHVVRRTVKKPDDPPIDNGILEQKYLKNNAGTHQDEQLCQYQSYEKTSTQSVYLERQTLIQTYKKHQCLLCERIFTTIGSLKRHMLTHTGEKPHQCPLCKLVFTAASSLKRHLMRRHKAEEPQEPQESLTQQQDVLANTYEQLPVTKSCEESSMQSTDKFSVQSTDKCSVQSTDKERQVILVGEKSYHCPVCNVNCKKLSNLKTHMLTHTRERPHQCPICAKGLMTKSSLKRHMVVHTGNRPYACPVCKKTYTQPGHVKEHLLVHKNERRYLCTVCGKAFFTLQKLKRHMTIHRSDEDTVDQSHHNISAEFQEVELSSESVEILRNIASAEQLDGNISDYLDSAIIIIEEY